MRGSIFVFAPVALRTLHCAGGDKAASETIEAAASGGSDTRLAALGRGIPGLYNPLSRRTAAKHSRERRLIEILTNSLAILLASAEQGKLLRNNAVAELRFTPMGDLARGLIPGVPGDCPQERRKQTRITDSLPKGTGGVAGAKHDELHHYQRHPFVISPLRDMKSSYLNFADTSMELVATTSSDDMNPSSCSVVTH